MKNSLCTTGILTCLFFVILQLTVYTSLRAQPHLTYPIFAPFNIEEIQLVSPTKGTSITVTLNPTGAYEVFPQNNNYVPPTSNHNSRDGDIPPTLVNETIYYRSDSADGKYPRVYRLSPFTPHVHEDLFSHWDFPNIDTVFQAFVGLQDIVCKFDSNTLFYRHYLEPSNPGYNFQKFPGLHLSNIKSIVSLAVVGKGNNRTSFIYYVDENDSLFQLILSGNKKPLPNSVGSLPNFDATKGLVALDTNKIAFVDRNGYVNVFNVATGANAPISNNIQASHIAGGNGYLFFLSKTVPYTLSVINTNDSIDKSSLYPGISFPKDNFPAMVTDAENNILIFTKKSIYKIDPTIAFPLTLIADDSITTDSFRSKIIRLPSKKTHIPINTRNYLYPNLEVSIKLTSSSPSQDTTMYISATIDPVNPFNFSFWSSNSPFQFPDSVAGITKQKIVTITWPSPPLAQGQITGLRMQIKESKGGGLTIGALIIDPKAD